MTSNSSILSSLQNLLSERLVIIDGAMGTMIQQHKLEEADYRGAQFKDWPSDIKGNNDLLSITQPYIIQEIHSQYLEAGAEIIETNTFNSQSVTLADYGMAYLMMEKNDATKAFAKGIGPHYSGIAAFVGAGCAMVLGSLLKPRQKEVA